MDITDGLEDGEGDLEIESTTEESSWIITNPNASSREQYIRR